LKRTNLLSGAAARLLMLPAAARPLLLSVTACVFLAAASASASAQTSTAETNAPQQSSQTPPQSSQTSAQADEDFELNIDTRRIDERDFHAETAVETDGARGLLLRVGVALRASDIEVLLRNVRGHVRFRASLAPVLRLLDARHVAAPPAPASTPP
jgi:hypothetical protein